MSLQRVILSLLVAALGAAPLQAGTLKVPSEAFPTIQSAVDAAASGDVVQVAKGRYPERVHVQTPGIALRGKGVVVIDASYAGDCILVEADDVEITNLVLANGGLGQLASDGEIAGGLHFIGHGAKLGKLTVHAPEDYGIWLEGLGSIDKCTVDGSFGYGIHVATHVPSSPVPATITRCTTRRCLTGIFAQDGPFVLEKNSCELNQSVGLELDLATIPADGASALPSVVSGNSASSSYVYAMLLSDSTGAGLRVEKNSCTGSGYGMLVSGLAVEVLSNTVADNFLGGMFLSASQCHVAKNKVRGNASFGIGVSYAAAIPDGSGPGGNHLEANSVQENGGDGIHVASDDNVLQDNLVKGNLGDGIELQDGGVTGNSLQDNTVLGNGHDGIDNGALQTLLQDNLSKLNGGADLAGAGKGAGTVAEGSSGNLAGDGTGLQTQQELDAGD